MKKWFTFIVQPPTVDATFHAKATAMEVAEKMGYRRLSIFRYDGNGESAEGLNNRIDGITAEVGWGDMVVFQYPTYNGYRFDKNFVSKMRARGCQVVLFIHDSDLVRRGASEENLAKEKDLFLSADLLITLGEPFNENLQSQGITTKMISKDVWNFYVDGEDLRLGNTLKKEVVYAGNLFKTTFLKNWNYPQRLLVFGDKGDMVLGPNVEHGGVCYPEELIRRMPRDCFGLAWDSDLENGGNYRTYTRYNCPEKIALYLALGLPVLVWDQSAIAKIVEKYQVGYSLSSLEDIDTLFAALSEDDLSSLKKRVNHFGTAVRDGFFTRQALVQAENYVLGLRD